MAAKGASVPDQVESFRKILSLEQDRGYDDTAVMGGLDRFLERLASNADLAGADVGDMLTVLLPRHEPCPETGVDRPLAGQTGWPHGPALSPGASNPAG